MNIITEEKKNQILEDFAGRNGMFHKLVFDGKVIGYIVRSEFEKQDRNEVDVGITISYNFYSYFDIERYKIIRNPGSDFIKARFFTENDLKLFTLLRNLKMNKKTLLAANYYNPPYVLQYHVGDDLEKFNCGIRSIVNTYNNALYSDIQWLRREVSHDDKYSMNILNVNEALFNDEKKLCALADYMYDKIERTLVYYKNRNVCLFL